MIIAFCSLLILQQVQPAFLYWALRYRPATNRNVRTWLVHVSSRTDLSIKETLLVKRRRWIQMQRKTMRKMNGLVTFGFLAAVSLKVQILFNVTLSCRVRNSSRFKGLCCRHLKGQIQLDSEYEDSIIP